MAKFPACLRGSLVCLDCVKFARSVFARERVAPGLLGTTEARGMARVEERRGEWFGRVSGHMVLFCFQL
jgi:hypothetical protein